MMGYYWKFARSVLVKFIRKKRKKMQFVIVFFCLVTAATIFFSALKQDYVLGTLFFYSLNYMTMMMMMMMIQDFLSFFLVQNYPVGVLLPQTKAVFTSRYVNFSFFFFNTLKINFFLLTKIQNLENMHLPVRYY